MSFGEAKPDDARAIAGLIRAAFAEYKGRLDPPSGALAETEEQVRDRIVHGRVILARRGEELVGCVCIEERPDHLHASRLAVLPGHRHIGVGSKLMAFVEEKAHAGGACRVRLGVRLALPQLLTYYERRGYRVVESRCHAGYSQPTYVILEKICKAE